MAIRSPGSASHSAAHPVGGRRRAHFRRDIGVSGLTLLTLGGIMGSGLFLASGMAIREAGPGIVAVFAVGFLAMYLEINALAEMSAASPVAGSFLVYCRQVLGPGSTFVTGWIYWFSSVLTMSSEVTAAALFTGLWFPAVPLWVWSLVYSAFIIFLNFFGVRSFQTVENLMAGLKTVAVFAFLVLGALLLTGTLPHAPTVAAPAWDPLASGGPLFPHGLPGAAAALLLVLFAYAGTGVVGMAAAETRRPEQTIPRAVRATVLLVGILYLGSAYLLVTLQPWSQVPTHASPFVTALRGTALPYAADLMNLVLLFAVLSTMNAALYANVRVLYTLGKEREAPAWLGRLNRHEVPAHATWTSAALLLGAILLAYLLPHRAYQYLVTATGFQAMFIWLMILVTHLFYRGYLRRHHPERLKHRLWGFPATTLLVIALVLVGLAGSLGVPAERVGALVGLAGIALTAAVWVVARGRLLPGIQAEHSGEAGGGG